MNNARLNIHGDLVVRVCRMKMRRHMVTIEHAYHNPEKPGYLWHICILHKSLRGCKSPPSTDDGGLTTGGEGGGLLISDSSDKSDCGLGLSRRFSVRRGLLVVRWGFMAISASLRDEEGLDSCFRRSDKVGPCVSPRRVIVSVLSMSPW